MDLIPAHIREVIPDRPDIPREFVHQFESEHLHRLRQRVFWYCTVVLGLLALSFTRIGLDLAAPPDIREPIAYIALRIISVTTLVAVYIGVTLYILPAERGRRQIINAYSVLIITTTLVLTLAMPRIDNGRLMPGAQPEQYGSAAVAQQSVTLFFILLLHLIASLLVELSPRDGVRIYVPMLLIYGIGLAIDRFLSTGAALRLAVVAPILGLPGLLWSLWRHRAFADKFVARAMSQRYEQVSKELLEARRVHEALFPPPVTRGPVHIRYRYEPMQDIGGDFLYIHPLSSPRKPQDVPRSVVVIDVTGHGFPAALAVNRLYVELTRAFSSSDDPSPAHVLKELNAAMVAGLMPEAIYATAIVLRGRMEGDRRILEWSGAGHPDAVLCRTDGEMVRLRSTAPMLGVLEPDMFRAEIQQIEIGGGDRVLAFTDGVLEARNPEGEQFGMDRIEAALREPAPKTSEPPQGGELPEQADAGSESAAEAREMSPVHALFNAVQQFRAGPTHDDVLIVEVYAAE